MNFNFSNGKRESSHNLNLNPFPAGLWYLNFRQLEVMFRYRDP